RRSRWRRRASRTLATARASSSGCRTTRARSRLREPGSAASRRLRAPEHLPDVLRDAFGREVLSHAREQGLALAEQLLPAHDAVAEANRDPGHLEARGLDDQGLVEARRLAVADARFDDRQVDAALRPRLVGDPTTVQPVDPTGLEVGEVVGVMHDTH